MNLESIRLKLVDLKTAREITDYILSMEENRKYETIILMWSWWDARNKVNAGEKRRTAEDVVHQARSMVWEVSAKQKKPNVKNHQKVKKWNPPPPDTLKVNIDGAFFMENKIGGWGFIVRDTNGFAVMAGAGKLESVHDAFCAEAQACLAALTAMSNQGMTRIQLESDSYNLVSALKSSAFDQSPAGVLLKEARHLIQLDFVDVEILFTPRSCNLCAHGLAHMSLSWDSDQPCVWFDPLPE